jgi:glutathione-regulated potassium-efflux system ancillary protein KefF
MPPKATVFHAHPYPQRSRAGRALLEAVRTLPGVEVRSLYSLYPDFAIDVAAEQEAVLASDLLVWQAPFYWYGLPAMMHLWFEKVLALGWAYGPGGDRVRGKRVLWAATTGAPDEAYRPGAMHGHLFETFVPPVAQTAIFCGMRWQPPLIVHGAHRIDDAALRARGDEYRTRVEVLLAETA